MEELCWRQCKHALVRVLVEGHLLIGLKATTTSAAVVIALEQGTTWFVHCVVFELSVRLCLLIFLLFFEFLQSAARPALSVHLRRQLLLLPLRSFPVCLPLPRFLLLQLLLLLLQLLLLLLPLPFSSPSPLPPGCWFFLLLLWLRFWLRLLLLLIFGAGFGQPLVVLGLFELPLVFWHFVGPPCSLDLRLFLLSHLLMGCCQIAVWLVPLRMPLVGFGPGFFGPPVLFFALFCCTAPRSAWMMNLCRLFELKSAAGDVVVEDITDLVVIKLHTSFA